MGRLVSARPNCTMSLACPMESAAVDTRFQGPRGLQHPLQGLWSLCRRSLQWTRDHSLLPGLMMLMVTFPLLS